MLLVNLLWLQPQRLQLTSMKNSRVKNLLSKWKSELGYKVETKVGIDAATRLYFISVVSSSFIVASAH